MKSRSKTALWAVVSMVFFATVSARPLQGGDDKDVAKTDSVAKVDTDKCVACGIYSKIKTGIP
jgi:hypothetical protein